MEPAAAERDWSEETVLSTLIWKAEELGEQSRSMSQHWRLSNHC